MHHAIRIMLFIAVLGSAAAVSAEEEKLVGDFRNRECWQIEGGRYFTSEFLTERLSDDLMIAVASHPRRLLDAYTKQMETALCRLYRSSGFRDVQISVAPDGDQRKLSIKIQEGPRSIAGSLQFDEVPATIRTEIARRFTESSPVAGAIRVLSGKTKREQRARWILPSEGDDSNLTFHPPIWTPGEGISYDDESQSQQKALIAEILAEHGYLNAQFNLELLPAKDEIVDLHVKLIELGPQATVGNLTVTGNERNPSAAVFEVAGLKQNSPLARYTVERAYNALRQSARFATVQIATKPIRESNTIDFSIAVAEVQDIPLLVKPLSAAATQMLKMCDFMSQLHDDDGDMVIEVRLKDQPGSIELVVSATRGWLCRMGPKDSAIGKFFHGWAIQTPEKWGIALPEEGRKLILTNDDYEPVRPKMTLNARADERGARFGFAFGNKESQPNWIPFEIAPSLVANVASSENFQLTQTGQICRASLGPLILEFDAETGRPTFLSCIPKEMPLTIDARLARGEFDATLAEFYAETKSLENQFDPAEPMCSTARFVLADAPFLHGILRVLELHGTIESAESGSRAAAAMLRLVEKHSPDQIFEGFRRDRRQSKSEKSHPQGPNDHEIKAATGSTGGVAQSLSRVVVIYTDAFAEPDSTSWTALRFAGLRLLGMGEETSKEMEVLVHCCRDRNNSVMAALPFLIADWPEGSVDADWIDLQLRQMTLKNFRSDYRQVLESDRLGSQTVVAAIDWVHKADSKEIDSLSTLLPSGYDAALVNFHQALKEQPESRSTKEKLAVLLDGLWMSKLEPVIRARLEKVKRAERSATAISRYPTTGKEEVDIGEYHRTKPERRERIPEPPYPHKQLALQSEPATQATLDLRKMYQVLPEGSVADELDDVFFPDAKNAAEGK